MSMTALRRIIPPPSEPIHTGGRTAWSKAMKDVGAKLPKDYLALAKAYGTGEFANGEIEIANPLDASYNTWIEFELRKLRDFAKAFPEDMPYPVYPEPGGLFPFGRDDNGNRFLWLTSGEPEQWPIICRSEADHWERVRHSISEFLLLLFTNELEIEYDKFWGNPYFGEGDLNFTPKHPKPAPKRKRKGK